MTLAAGKTLAHYEILGPLGAGGMGEVYRAKDTRLGREVAIKVLPEALANDPELLRRFQREAKTLASLNHSNIGGIYGYEEADAIRFLALEMVPGEDLAERLERGPLPVETAIDVCRQIAEGLEVAHEAGVVHRDLKPANVRITPEGIVKILDFGLAKPIPNATNGPALTAQADSSLRTSEGMVLGTPAYMSPEQASGKPVDRRTDIWAFGCVLFECLTAWRPFIGRTFGDLMAAILAHDVDFGRLPANTPAPVRHLIERSLIKDSRARLRDIGEARVLLANPATLMAPANTGRSHRWRRTHAVLPWTLATAAIAAAAFFALSPGADSQDGSTRGLSFESKTFGQQLVYTARFLPDGQGIVYSSALTGNKPDVYLLPRGSTVPQKIAPSGTLLLSVSAEGELAVLTDTDYFIHRVHRGTLATMSLHGSPRPLIENVRDADWGPNGELAIVRRQSARDRLEYPPGTVLYETSGYVSEPRVSADGSQVAFLDHSFWQDNRGWVKVVDLEGKVTTLSDEYYELEGLTWALGGERLYFSGANFSNGGELQVYATGLEGDAVRREFEFPGAVIVLDAAADGRWLMMQQDLFTGVAVKLPGQQVDTDVSWLDSCWRPDISPDQQTIAFTNGHGGESYSVITRRIDGSPISTLGEGDSCGFSPDGRWVAALLIASPGVVLYPTGPGSPKPLPRGPLKHVIDAQWYPDSKNLLITAYEPSRGLRMYRQSIDAGLPKPMTPEGIAGLLSPKGDQVIALDSESAWQLYPLDGSSPRKAPGMDADDQVLAWGPEGDAVYVRRGQIVPLPLVRVDLATGDRTADIELGPRQQPGLVWTKLDHSGGGRVFDPTRGYAYDYCRQLSRLFLVR